MGRGRIRERVREKEKDLILELKKFEKGRKRMIEREGEREEEVLPRHSEKERKDEKLWK